MQELKANGSGPVVEDRFFEPGLAEKSWGEPVAARGHVLGDPSVARFVWTDQTNGAESNEKADGENDYDEKRDEKVIEPSAMFVGHGAEVYQRCACGYMLPDAGWLTENECARMTRDAGMVRVCRGMDNPEISGNFAAAGSAGGRGECREVVAVESATVAAQGDDQPAAGFS
jgi:hypothetical protein